jgi:hypothetical protein
MLQAYRKANRAELFFEELKEEIITRSQLINNVMDDGNMDGFLTTNISDGWVRYRGMSWGIAVCRDPGSIVMTWGPDGPFVGSRKVLLPRESDGETVWHDEWDENLIFESAAELANYGLAVLAGMVGDTIPLIR